MWKDKKSMLLILSMSCQSKGLFLFHLQWFFERAMLFVSLFRPQLYYWSILLSCGVLTLSTSFVLLIHLKFVVTNGSIVCNFFNDSNDSFAIQNGFMQCPSKRLDDEGLASSRLAICRRPSNHLYSFILQTMQT